ncbi:hypothetical protein BH24CHL1_BH24CHL1_19860 [soil metagenome]|jgi:hypothetical protein
MTNNDMAVVWTFVGSLATVKLLTSIMILYYFPSWHTLVLVLALSVVWIVPPFYYFTRHSRGRYRLLRARVRRNELLRQEWEVEETQPQSRA